MNQEVLRERLENILVRTRMAWNIAFNEIDPHNDEKHPDHDGMQKVADRSREIEAEALPQILDLISEHTAVVERESRIGQTIDSLSKTLKEHKEE